MSGVTLLQTSTSVRHRRVRMAARAERDLVNVFTCDCAASYKGTHNQTGELSSGQEETSRRKIR